MMLRLNVLPVQMIWRQNNTERPLVPRGWRDLGMGGCEGWGGDRMGTSAMWESNARCSRCLRRAGGKDCGKRERTRLRHFASKECVYVTNTAEQQYLRDLTWRLSGLRAGYEERTSGQRTGGLGEEICRLGVIVQVWIVGRRWGVRAEEGVWAVRKGVPGGSFE